MEIPSMINAGNFKTNINKLTESRIRLIMQYVVYCYLQILSDKKTYNYSERGKIPKEEFLRNGLVNDYLQKSYNKEYFKQHISDNLSVEITFHPEEAMPYIDFENKQRTDKIDIAVWENILQSIWSGKTDNEIRFAIECKRIENIPDSKKYIGDICKFCDRPFYCYNNRLSFEGQIAFIENAKITHSVLKDKINDKLKNHKSIITDNLLDPVGLNDKFDGTYLSKHKRNVENNPQFSIYHLLLDYSNIVVD